MSRTKRHNDTYTEMGRTRAPYKRKQKHLLNTFEVDFITLDI